MKTCWVDMEELFRLGSFVHGSMAVPTLTLTISVHFQVAVRPSSTNPMPQCGPGPNTELSLLKCAAFPRHTQTCSPSTWQRPVIQLDGGPRPVRSKRRSLHPLGAANSHLK